MAKITDKSNRQIVKYVLIFIFPIVIYLILFSVGLVGEGSQQFSDLANAFIHGQTNFLHSIGGIGQDPVLYHGKIYWDEGPFPAVVLMPFVGLFNLFHLFFYQGYIKWLFVLGIGAFVYKIARRLKYTPEDSLIMVVAFSLSSVFIGIDSVSSGWLFAQVINTFLMLWVLYEYMHNRRWWLIGVICAFILLTRITAAPIVLFFVIALLASKLDTRQKLNNLAKLLGVVVIGCLLMGAYNYNRFGSPLNNGNSYQLISADSAEARSLGLFSLDHIPTNLYTALLRGPIIVQRDSLSWTMKFPYIINNPLGMSMILTSPYLLYLFSRRWSKYPKEAKYLLIAAGISAVLVLSYYGDGADQFGYRYSMDFMPELFLAFMMLYRKYNQRISRGMKLLIIGSVIFNFYLVCTYVNIH